MDEKYDAMIENFKLLSTFELQRKSHLDRLFILAVGGVTALLAISEKAGSPELVPLAILAILFPVALRSLHTAEQHYQVNIIRRHFFNRKIWGLEALEKVRKDTAIPVMAKRLAPHSLAVVFSFLTVLMLIQSCYLASKSNSNIVLFEGLACAALMAFPITGLVRINLRGYTDKFKDIIDRVEQSNR